MDEKRSCGRSLEVEHALEQQYGVQAAKKLKVRLTVVWSQYFLNQSHRVVNCKWVLTSGKCISSL